MTETLSEGPPENEHPDGTPPQQSEVRLHLYQAKSRLIPIRKVAFSTYLLTILLTVRAHPT